MSELRLPTSSRVSTSVAMVALFLEARKLFGSSGALPYRIGLTIRVTVAARTKPAF
jgi:hypothetical protein